MLLFLHNICNIIWKRLKYSTTEICLMIKLLILSVGTHVFALARAPANIDKY